MSCGIVVDAGDGGKIEVVGYGGALIDGAAQERLPRPRRHDAAVVVPQGRGATCLHRLGDGARLGDGLAGGRVARRADARAVVVREGRVVEAGVAWI